MTTITGAGAHSSAEASDKIPAMKSSTKGYLTLTQILAYVSGSSTFQPLDSDLTAIAALTTTSYGRALLALADLAALRTVLGPSGTPSSSTFLRGDGSWATPAGGGGGDLLASNNLSDIDDAATARTNLGLAIGTNVQAYDAELAALAGLTSAADKVPYFTGSGAASTADMTSVARTLIAQTTQALMRTAGLGMSANGSSLVAAADYAAMRALLDLEAGTDFLSPAALAAAYQALDSDLTAIAALAPSNDDVIQRKAGAWTNRTMAQVLVDLATAGAKTVGKETVWIPAVAMISRTTNGAAAGTAETTTNKNMIKTLDFDTSTQEFAQFRIHFPKSWNLGTVTFQPVWSHASTTTNFGVVWALQAVAHSDDDAGDVAFGTEQTSTDTGGTTDDIYIGPESSAITIAGTPAAGDIVQFQLKRNVSDGSDTMAVDARLHGIRLFFTSNASTDA